MGIIRPVDDDGEYLAALAAPRILAEALALMAKTWTCRWCGYVDNRGGDEFCHGCRREDCSCGDLSLPIDERGRVTDWSGYKG